MISPVFAVRDVLNGFLCPMIDLSNESAIRNFKYALQSNDLMGFCPSDYDLYCLGTYNTDDGHFDALLYPDLVIRGSEAVKP